MPGLSQARAKKVPFTANLGPSEEGGEDIVITGFFNPRAYSPKRLREIGTLTTDNMDYLGEMLAGKGGKLLVSWDLTFTKEDFEEGFCTEDQIGEIVPITVEALSAIPVDILSAVANAVSGTARPNSGSSPETSESFSSLTEEEGPVLENTSYLEPSDTSEEPSNPGNSTESPSTGLT